jgi:hypothetical protein
LSLPFSRSVHGAAAGNSQRIMVIIEDVGHKELIERHLLGSDGKPDGRLLDWQRIIEAKVP